jgi:endoglycosylceramidase
VLFLTEFGASDDLDDIGRIVELADRHMVSWQYWHYCDCEDPTTSGPGVQSLVIDPARPPRGKNLKRDKLEVLARPYPRAVAGTPELFRYNEERQRFKFVYSTESPAGEALPRPVKTEVVLPRIHYRDGYRARTEGAEVTSQPGARILRLKREEGADSVSLKVRPRQ